MIYLIVKKYVNDNGILSELLNIGCKYTDKQQIDNEVDIANIPNDSLCDKIYDDGSDKKY